MKRRHFLTSTVSLAGLSVPFIARGESRPCPPDQVKVAGGSSVSGLCGGQDAEADWIARATAPGVVWAHDFRSDAEVDQFLWVSGTGNVTTQSGTDGNCRRVTTDGITGGGCLELNIPGNTAAAVVGATSTSPITFTTATAHGHAVGSRVYFAGLPGDFASLNNRNTTGTPNTYSVAEVLSPTKFRISVNGSAFGPYASGGTSTTYSVCSTQWRRPFSALSGETNGLGVDDIGSREGHPLRTWLDQGAATDWRWRKDYFGHVDYHEQFPTWNNSVTGEVEKDPWRGTDFWLQFRVKISGSRWQFADTGIGSPGGKLIFIETSGVQGLQQIVMRSEDTTSREGYPKVEPTSRLSLYTNGTVARSLYKGSLIQPGGDFDSGVGDETSCILTSPAGSARYWGNCWRWPKDEWVTVLIHVIPGHHFSSAGSMWPNGGDTGLQVWAAKQSELHKGYVRIIDALDWPFYFDSDGLHPPAWNQLRLVGYMNNIPAAVGFTHRFDQVILSTKYIACPKA